jgi:hypothetical protein
MGIRRRLRQIKERQDGTLDLEQNDVVDGNEIKANTFTAEEP